MAEHYAGLDVGVAETAICVVDLKGAVALQTAVATESEGIAKALSPYRASLRRAGHEAGELSPWLQPALKDLGVSAVCLETRHVRAALSAQRNKTAATDALGLAHLMRTGWYRPAHVKTETAYRLRLLLIQRRNLKRKFLDLENSIRDSLKSFGVKLTKVGRGGFDRAVREVCADDPLTAELMDCMLTARAALWTQYLKLHALTVRAVADDEVCRRFMAIPRRGTDRGSDLPHGGGRPRPVQAVPRRGHLLRPDLQALAVGHVDRHPGAHQQGGRSRRAARPLRGGLGDADPLQGALRPQDLGRGDRPALPQESGRGRGPQARRDHARHVARRDALRRSRRTWVRDGRADR
jgi:hypothetical protein